mgnify:CR=1 FL=1
MLEEEIIRNKVKNKVLDETNKKVRNVFYVTAGTDGKSVYAICGNNNKIFGVALVSANLDIEVVL